MMIRLVEYFVLKNTGHKSPPETSTGTMGYTEDREELVLRPWAR